MRNVITILLVLVATLSIAQEERPRGFPGYGEEMRILTIDATDYRIEADGLMHKVTRAVKVMTPDLDRIFLFQIKPGTGAIIIKDQKGIVTEIWLLPDNYPLMES